VTRAEQLGSERPLPEGWRSVRFGEVVKHVKENVDPAEAGIERYVAGEHMDTDDLRLRRWGKVGDGYLGPAFHRRFAKGQVLYGSRRTYLRKVVVAPFAGVCANTTFVLEPATEDLLPDLLPSIMQTDAFSEHSVKQSKGSVNPYINWKDLAWYEFLLPPKSEQHRIVEILNSGHAYLDRLMAVHEVAESCLSSMYAQLISNSDAESVSLSALASRGWVEFQTGPFGTVLKASSYAKVGIPIINPTQMVNGSLETEAGPFLDEQEALRLSRYRSQTNDIVLGRKGDVGRAVFINESTDGFLVGSDCIRIRVNTIGKLNASFLYRCLLAPETRQWLLRHSSGTTMPGMNEKILGGVQVPLPDENDQRAVSTVFEVAETARKRAVESIQTLRSVLTEARNTLLHAEIGGRDV
jgi:type I restriction enzyme S subunit